MLPVKLHSILQIIQLYNTYILAYEHTLPKHSDLISQRYFALKKQCKQLLGCLLVDIIPGNFNAQTVISLFTRKGIIKFVFYLQTFLFTRILLWVAWIYFSSAPSWLWANSRVNIFFRCYEANDRVEENIWTQPNRTSPMNWPCSRWRSYIYIYIYI